MTVDKYPSRACAIMDLPEPADLQAEFIYNFFVKDESVNNIGGVPRELLSTPAAFFTAEFIDNLTRTVPRYVRLYFKTPTLTSKQGSDAIKPTTKSAQQFAKFLADFSIEQNYSKLTYESHFTNNSFLPVEFYDNSIDKRLFLAVSGSIAQETAIFNDEKGKLIEEQVSQVKSTILRNRSSQLDGARALNNATPDDVTPDFIYQALVNIESLGALIIDDKKQKALTENKFERIKRLKLRSRVNGMIIGDVTAQIANNPTGLLADEFAPYVQQARGLQAAAAAKSNSNFLSMGDYEATLDPVFSFPPGQGTSPSMDVAIVGYVIQKYEILADGTSIELDPIFIENEHDTNTIDFKVAYGKYYGYNMRTVALVTLESTAEGTDEIVNSTFMIASGPTSATIRCTEKLPPPPPADFNVMYDYDERAPRLTWNLPVNTQQDVKYFQVFRRENLQEPFTLLRQFDFDDSEVKYDSYEYVSPQLVQRTDKAHMFFTDYEFTKESRYIYAVCCRDAHGLTSLLSPQFEVSFNKYKNRLVKKLISRSGAPKSYPNLYLLKDGFIDTIKDSGHERVKIYFDPEFIDVLSSQGTSLDLITTDIANGKYRLQFINTDLQQSQLLDIIISDLRSKRRPLKVSKKK